jgi:hypothetical protein
MAKIPERVGILDIEQAAELMFDHMNSGHQIYLSDGSVWRASADTATVVRSWQSGDPIVVSEKSANAVWRFVLLNQVAGTFASALPSSRLGHSYL